DNDGHSAVQDRLPRERRATRSPGHVGRAERTVVKKDEPAEKTALGVLAITPDMSSVEALRRLRVNALAVHQRSMGRSDELVRILERTVGQVEKTHNRVKLLSTLLFVAGLALLAAAAAAILAGQQELWAVAIGGVGGLAAVAAVFWTGPLEQIESS